MFSPVVPVISNKYTFGTSSREMFYLYPKMMGSVEAKTLFLDVTM